MGWIGMEIGGWLNCDGDRGRWDLWRGVLKKRHEGMVQAKPLQYSFMVLLFGHGAKIKRGMCIGGLDRLLALGGYGLGWSEVVSWWEGRRGKRGGGEWEVQDTYIG